jgi:catechol 2,3-dioxygenase-like lactoylglutathione lyase family enzyme
VERGAVVTGILETCLYTVDLESTAAFYENVLGLTVHSHVAGRHVFFRCGPAMFLLFDPRTTGASDSSVPAHGAPGPGHVCCAIGDDALEAWRERLINANVDIEHEQSWPRGGRSIYVRDPAGNSVELASPGIWGISGLRTGMPHFGG